MTKTATDALFWYLQTMDRVPPGKGLFIGARAHEGLPDKAGGGSWTFVQSFKPWANELTGRGFTVHSELDGGDGYDFACVLTARQDAEAKGMLAQAALALKDGGLLVAAAPSDAGGKRLEADGAALGLTGECASKYHTRIFAARRTDRFDALKARDWIAAADYRTVEATGMVSRPGLFAWDRLDQGSALLLEHLPRDLKGRGGDFGCGHGALAQAVLAGQAKVTSLLCLDADARAVEACRRNLAAFTDRADCRWADVTANAVGAGTLDFIVMNPPFHADRDSDPGIGLAFIAAAKRALHRGGRLYLVANNHLPYEATLRETFHGCERLAERDGFKVFRLVA